MTWASLRGKVRGLHSLGNLTEKAEDGAGLESPSEAAYGQYKQAGTRRKMVPRLRLLSDTMIILAPTSQATASTAQHDNKAVGFGGFAGPRIIRSKNRPSYPAAACAKRLQLEVNTLQTHPCCLCTRDVTCARFNDWCRP